MKTRVARHCGTRRSMARVLAVGLLLLAPLGCNRAFYRRQADREAYAAVNCAAADPRWSMEGFTIQPDAQSRMLDPDNPDCPPMPPDDPISHRKMHCVDCNKRGWPCWHCCGQTPNVENPAWRLYLPYDENGVVVLDREGALRMALLHSREYQQELEDLYLTALDVTFQRFRFDAQFFGMANSGTNSATFTADGPQRPGGGGDSQSTLQVNNSLQMRRLMTTGGTLVADMANSLVWQFSGPDQSGTTTLLDFSLVQPLLRAGGRAVAMEALTDSERTLVANVRQMARYRQSFCTQIITGRNPSPGPTPGGITLANVFPSQVAGAAQVSVSGIATGGILGLLAERQTIRNQRANVAALLDSLEQLEAAYQANRVDRFQVDLIRQSLYDAQSRLLGLDKAHQDRLDAFKLTLGLPPNLNVRIADPWLDQFNMIDPSLTATQDALSELLGKLRDKTISADEATMAGWLDQLSSLHQEIAQRLETVKHDMQVLADALPARRQSMQQLALREEFQRGDVDPSVVDIAALDRRVKTVNEDFVKLSAELNATLSELEKALRDLSAPAEAAPAKDYQELRQQLVDLAGRLSGQLTDLSLVEAQARVETLTLVPLELDPSEAFEIARSNRLDWMNARAALVDVWRQIEVTANALKSGLNLTFSGDISTLGNNPVRFRGTTGRLRVGVQFDAPLTRLAERNAYREALIDYQRARRAYYAVEDRISQSLRGTLRNIRLDQLNFEIRRAAVYVAIVQVDVKRFLVRRPPQAGVTSQFGPTTARDLATALQQLLSSQDAILGVWGDYEAQRMALDLDMGTMRLDARGMWIDPGPIQPGTVAPVEPPEEIPAPDAALQQIGPPAVY